MVDENALYGTKSSTRQIGEIKPFVESRTIKTKSGQEQVIQDTTMYVVNFSAEQGYTIIATDGLTQNIVAVVESGSLGSITDISAGNHPMIYYSLLSYYNEKQEMQVNQEALCTSAEAKLAQLGIDPQVFANDYAWGPWKQVQKGPYIKSKWGFDSNWSTKAKAKCRHQVSLNSSISALCQILAWNKTPDFFANHEYYFNDPVIYQEMMNCSNPNTPGLSTDAKDAILDLYADMSILFLDGEFKRCINMACPNYGKESVLLEEQINEGIGQLDGTYFNYGDNTNYQETTPWFCEDLDKHNSPYMVIGSDKLTSTIKHSWIVDGYKGETRQMTIPGFPTLTDYDKITMVHCNMGYAGLSNGYYNLSSVILSGIQPEWVDSGSSILKDDNNNYANKMRRIYFVKR